MVIATATHRAGGEGKESKSISSDTNRARTRKLGQAVGEVIGIVEALSPFALSPRSQRPGASTALPEGGRWMSIGIVFEACGGFARGRLFVLPIPSRVSDATRVCDFSDRSSQSNSGLWRF